MNLAKTKTVYWLLTIINWELVINYYWLLTITNWVINYYSF